MRKWTLYCAALSVSACATNPTLHTTLPQPAPVQIPVAEQCVQPADVPTPPTPTEIDPDHATKTQLAAALAADVYAWEAYGKFADPILRRCAKKGVSP